ncbi:hypothetical protein VYU27_010262 [Nannochloropsis oceanica]
MCAAPASVGAANNEADRHSCSVRERQEGNGGNSYDEHHRSQLLCTSSSSSSPVSYPATSPSLCSGGREQQQQHHHHHQEYHHHQQQQQQQQQRIRTEEMEGAWGGRWKIKKVKSKEEGEEEAMSMEGLVASVQRLKWERDAVSG